MSRRGNRYVILAVDSYTKWLECRAIPRKTDNLTAQFLLEDVLARHGCPRVVMSDNGNEFRGAFDALLSGNGIAHRFSPAMTPHVNGQAERVVRNVVNALQKMVDDQPQTWDEHLPFILLGQRSSRHESTGTTPFYLVHGRNPVLPVERRLAAPPPTARPPAPANEGAGTPVPPGAGPTRTPIKAEAGQAAPEWRERHGVIHIDDDEDELDGELEEGRDDDGPAAAIAAAMPRAEANMKEAQRRQTVAYKRRMGQSIPSDGMPEGSMVWMKAPASSKLHPGCEGPYRVVKYSEDYARAIIEDAGGKQWPIHVGRITPYKAGTSALLMGEAPPTAPAPSADDAAQGLALWGKRGHLLWRGAQDVMTTEIGRLRAVAADLMAPRR